MSKLTKFLSMERLDAYIEIRDHYFSGLYKDCRVISFGDDWAIVYVEAGDDYYSGEYEVLLYGDVWMTKGYHIYNHSDE